MNAKINTCNSMLLSMVASALLVGCGGTAPKPLYQWESYNYQVYEYLKGQGNGPEAQVNVLEEDLQKIYASGNSPPPGYHAQLGLLYAHIGKGDRVVQEFQAEKNLFPESAVYMDFLLKEHKK